MGQRIEFSSFGMSEYRELHARQQGRCALSGEPLNETVVLHHVVPASHGGARTQDTDTFVADWRQNGVLVNDEIELDSGRETGPHLHAHGGSFREGAFRSFGDFPYSHGDDLNAHLDWAARGERFVQNEIFPSQVKAVNERVEDFEQERER